MSGLKIVYDEERKSLFSTGARPNGILHAALHEDECYLVISAIADPERIAREARPTMGGGPEVRMVTREGKRDDANEVRVDTREAAEACDGIEPLLMLYRAAAATVEAAAAQMSKSGPAWIVNARAAVEMADEIAKVIEERLGIELR